MSGHVDPFDVVQLQERIAELDAALAQSEGEREDLDTARGILLGENVELQHQVDELTVTNRQLAGAVVELTAGAAEARADRGAHGWRRLRSQGRAGRVPGLLRASPRGHPVSALHAALTAKAAEDGWDGIDAEGLLGSAAEAIAWALIEQTSDTADREPSEETIREAMATSRRMLEVLAAHAPARKRAGSLYPVPTPTTTEEQR